MGFFERWKGKKTEIAATILADLAHVVVAFRIIFMGSSLLDLQIRLQQSFAVTSKLIAVHATGYLVGSAFGGLLDRYVNVYLLLFQATVIAGLGVMIAPWFYSFLAMAGTLFVAGIANSICDLAAHALLIKLWEKEAGNYIQMLHVSFSFGALLAPIIVRPFLLPLPEIEPENPADTYSFHHPDEILVQWPWSFNGILSIVVGLLFLVFYFNDRGSENQEKKIGQTKNPFKSPYKKYKIYIATIYVGLTAFGVFSIQGTVCCFIQAFGVKSDLKMDKKAAALLMSMFWASNMVSKIVFVSLSSKITERKLVWFFASLCTLGIVLMIIFTSTSELALWISTIFLSFGYSPLFAIGYSNLGQYFQMDGSHFSAIIMMGISGDSVSNVLVGSFFDHNPNFYLYYLALITTIFVVMVFSMPYVFKLNFGKLEFAEDDFGDEFEGPHRCRMGSILVPYAPRRSRTSVVSNTSSQRGPKS